MCAHVIVLLSSGVGRKKILGGGGGGGGGADRERSFMLFWTATILGKMKIHYNM